MEPAVSKIPLKHKPCCNKLCLKILLILLKKLKTLLNEKRMINDIYETVVSFKNRHTSKLTRSQRVRKSTGTQYFKGDLG